MRNLILLLKATQKGVTAKVNEPKLEAGSVTVGGAIDDKNFAGLDGDFPFIDVTFKVENDEFYEANAQLESPILFTGNKVNQNQIECVYFKIKHSQLCP